MALTSLRPLFRALWLFLILAVIVGELLPGSSPVLAALNTLHISDKAEHFLAYLALAFLPVLSFENRRTAVLTSLSMFLLGILLEGGQHFSPGRSVELADVVANGAGVTCGALLALPLRSLRLLTS